MKKIIIILLGLLSIAAFIWYGIQPDVFMQCLDTITYYLNMPLPIIGISVISLMIFAWELYSHSAVGKKQLAEFKKENEELKNEIKDYKLKTDEKINDLKETYEDKLSVVYSQFNFYETSIVNILKEVPNKRVQEEVYKFENTYNEKKAEISEIMSDNYPAIQEKLNEIENQFKELMAKYEEEINNKAED